jgi:CBS-domain-containing membrane protein
MMASYWRKMTGLTQSPPRVGWGEILWSWLGSFLGVAAVAFLHYRYFEGTDLLLIIGSFGASAVLIYGAIKSPLAQPRNFVGGHIISALIAVTMVKICGPYLWLAAALAVSLSVATMHATKTLHPPGGATALIAVISGPKIQNLGYLYALMPVATGALIMLVVALLVNNLAPARRYPEFWW